MQKAVLSSASGRTAASAPRSSGKAKAQQRKRRSVVVASADSPSPSSSSSTPEGVARRNALAMGAAAAIGLGSSFLYPTLSARAEEGGEVFGGELAERTRRKASDRDSRIRERRKLNLFLEKKLRNRIHDPLRHRFPPDVVRRLRRQRPGDGQVSPLFDF